MVDISALLRAEVRLQNKTRSQWTGSFGETELTLYSKPLTPQDNHQVIAEYPRFNDAYDMGGMAYYIFLKAETEDGTKAFSKKDKPVLLVLGQDKIGEIFQALFGKFLDELNVDEEAANAAHEELVKN